MYDYREKTIGVAQGVGYRFWTQDLKRPKEPLGQSLEVSNYFLETRTNLDKDRQLQKTTITHVTFLPP